MNKTVYPKASRPIVLLTAIMIGVSQLGCAGGAEPVAAALAEVIYWIGQKAAEAAVFVAVEKLMDQVFGKHGSESEMEVSVDPTNSLRGKCKGPLTIQNANDKTKVFVLVDFPVHRDSVTGKWKVDADYTNRIEQVLKGR